MSNSVVLDDDPDAPAARRSRVRQAVNDALLDIVWVGAIPVPGVDGLLVAFAQANMIERICSEYGVPIARHRSLALIATLSGGTLATAVQVGARWLKLFPGLGLFAGAPAAIAMSCATTYAIADLFVRHLERGGDPATLDPFARTPEVPRSQRAGLRRFRWKRRGRTARSWVLAR